MLSDAVALVRCHLDGPDQEAQLRYVPLAEFELWRHLMESRHQRTVTVEAVSYWIAEPAAWWNSGFSGEELQPVLRLRFERVLDGVPVLMERFFPAETYPQAQEALLSHFGPTERVQRLAAAPGYFVPPSSARPELLRLA